MSENEYRSIFVNEVKEHILEIFNHLKSIDKIGRAEEEDLFDIFRRFHTLKGMANTMGQVGMGEIAHILEEMLEYIRENPEVIFSFREFIQRGINAISTEIDNYERDIPFSSGEIITELSYILKEIKKKPVKQQRDLSPRFTELIDLRGLYETVFEIDKNSRTPAVRAFLLYREFSSKYKIIHSLPSLESLKQGIRPSRMKLYTQVKPDEDFIHSLIGRVGEIKLLGYDIYRENEESKKSRQIRYVHIPFERVEKFTSALDELLLLWNKYRYSISEENVDPFILRIEFSLKKLSGYVEDLRTVPIGTILPRINAIINTTAKSLGKDVSLRVENEDIEVDKGIIDRLEEPLMHIIRNAIYHGIEFLEERVKKGKSEKGLIELIFLEEEGYISIKVRDDGKGMDIEKILDTAVEKGLVNKGQESLSEDEILDLVFIPGFSTVKEADMTSGRGFGMDIVRNIVWQMGGDVFIRSHKDIGTEIILKIPYQFASKKVVIGEISGLRYAFDILGVKYILKKNDVSISQDKRFILRGDEKISLLNGGYINPEFFIVCSNGEQVITIGIDEIIFVGETRLYKVPYVLKSSKFISGMVVIKGICPVPVISVEYLISERNL